MTAAYEACWAMTRAEQEEFAEAYGLDTPEGLTNFGLLFFILSKITKESDEKVLDLMRARLGAETLNVMFCDEVLALDEAVEVLDKRDREHVFREQAEIPGKKAARNQFRNEYKAKRAAVNKAAAERVAAAAAKAKAKAKAKPKADPVPPPKYPEAFDVTQQEMKVFCPPGGHIWRSLTRKEWHGHYAPEPRTSCSFSDGKASCRDAATNVLRTLWSIHIMMHGLENDSCPWEACRPV